MTRTAHEAMRGVTYWPLLSLEHYFSEDGEVWLMCGQG
jgi:hypothetical protein